VLVSFPVVRACELPLCPIEIILCGVLDNVAWSDRDKSAESTINRRH
jgi:hypothetical protein